MSEVYEEAEETSRQEVTKVLREEKRVLEGDILAASKLLGV